MGVDWNMCGHHSWYPPILQVKNIFKIFNTMANNIQVLELILKLQELSSFNKDA